jgi:hypothetical protein
MRRTVTATLTAALVLAGSGSALAKPTIQVKPKTVHAGNRVRVSGSAGGCTKGEHVIVMSRAFSHKREFAGVPAVLALVRPNGRYGVRTRIPRKRKPRRYTVTARCGGGNFGVVRRLRVLAPG